MLVWAKYTFVAPVFTCFSSFGFQGSKVLFLSDRLNQFYWFNSLNLFNLLINSTNLEPIEPIKPMKPIELMKPALKL